ncbi:MAG: dUTP diphosphatase [Coriobacteriales bacterium]
MSDVSLPIHRLFDDVVLPEYAYAGDAGLDLRTHEAFSLEPHQRTLVSTGIQVAIPEGYAGFVLPRSGLAIRRGLTLVNAPGLIDSHYRGEVKLAVVNLDPNNVVTVARGERIAQLVVLPVPVVRLHEVAELGETDRGSHGFGSSGTA